MKLRSSVRKLFLSLTTLGGIMFSACQPEAILPDEGFALYYPAVSEIAPGTILEVPPTWYDGKPTDFSITSVTLDGEAVDVECFSMNQQTGALIINTKETDSVGIYDKDAGKFHPGIASHADKSGTNHVLLHVRKAGVSSGLLISIRSVSRMGHELHTQFVEHIAHKLAFLRDEPVTGLVVQHGEQVYRIAGQIVIAAGLSRFRVRHFSKVDQSRRSQRQHERGERHFRQGSLFFPFRHHSLLRDLFSEYYSEKLGLAFTRAVFRG